MRLREVEYGDFLGAVKRFGYRINLNSEHIKSISKEIRLNVDEMENNKTSPYSIVYKDEQYFFKEKRYNVSALLRLGFLLCNHYNTESQELDLWHLINSRLEENVWIDKVKELLGDLCYIAINMNISK